MGRSKLVHIYKKLAEGNSMCLCLYLLYGMRAELVKKIGYTLMLSLCHNDAVHNRQCYLTANPG